MNFEILDQVFVSNAKTKAKELKDWSQLINILHIFRQFEIHSFGKSRLDNDFFWQTELCFLNEENILPTLKASHLNEGLNLARLNQKNAIDWNNSHSLANFYLITAHGQKNALKLADSNLLLEESFPIMAIILACYESNKAFTLRFNEINNEQFFIQKLLKKRPLSSVVFALSYLPTWLVAYLYNKIDAELKNANQLSFHNWFEGILRHIFNYFIKNLSSDFANGLKIIQNLIFTYSKEKRPILLLDILAPLAFTYLGVKNSKLPKLPEEASIFKNLDLKQINNRKLGKFIISHNFYIQNRPQLEQNIFYLKNGAYLVWYSVFEDEEKILNHLKLLMEQKLNIFIVILEKTLPQVIDFLITKQKIACYIIYGNSYNLVKEIDSLKDFDLIPEFQFLAYKAWLNSLEIAKEFYSEGELFCLYLAKVLKIYLPKVSLIKSHSNLFLSK